MKGEAYKKEEVMLECSGIFLVGGGHAGLMWDFLVDKLAEANN